MSVGQSHSREWLPSLLCGLNLRYVSIPRFALPWYVLLLCSTLYSSVCAWGTELLASGFHAETEMGHLPYFILGRLAPYTLPCAIRQPLPSRSVETEPENREQTYSSRGYCPVSKHLSWCYIPYGSESTTINGSPPLGFCR